MDYNTESGFSQAVKERTDAIVRLAIALAGGGSQLPDLELIRERVDIVHGLIFNLDRKVSEFMSTQESRLQGIATKIDEVLSDLAALKANNPQIEDEIAAIEAKLSITQPTPEEGGETPTPEV